MPRGWDVNSLPPALRTPERPVGSQSLAPWTPLLCLWGPQQSVSPAVCPSGGGEAACPLLASLGHRLGVPRPRRKAPTVGILSHGPPLTQSGRNLHPIPSSRDMSTSASCPAPPHHPHTWTSPVRPGGAQPAHISLASSSSSQQSIVAQKCGAR